MRGRLPFQITRIGTVPIKKDEAIGLERLDRFTIQEISLTANADGLLLVGDGIVGQVRTKTGHIPIEHQLTAFNVLWHNQQLAGLFMIVARAFPTILGAYRLWKEFKR